MKTIEVDFSERAWSHQAELYEIVEENAQTTTSAHSKPIRHDSRQHARQRRAHSRRLIDLRNGRLSRDNAE
jgi:hypothetical protein